MLRDYQTCATSKVRDLWTSGKRRVVLVAPVGAGKTRIAQEVIASALDGRWAQVFFCAHTETLLDQPAQRYPKVSAYIKAGREADPTAMLQFCSAQTLVRREIIPQHERAIIIVDECHRIKTQTYMDILHRFTGLYQECYGLYLTATPYRLDGRGLADIADELVEVTTPRALMEMNPPVILSPIYWGVESPADGAIAGNIVGTWMQRASDRQTICRASSIAHSKQIAAQFVTAGVSAAHIDGSMSSEVRRRLLVQFAIGQIRVLCAGSSLLDEGYDSWASYCLLYPSDLDAWRRARLDPSPENRQAVYDSISPDMRDFWLPDFLEPPAYAPLSCLIDAAPTSSRGAWMQRQGRVVRAWWGYDDETTKIRAKYGLEIPKPKPRPIILDHAGNLDRHGALIYHEGFYLTEDLVKLKKPTAINCNLPKTCPNCLCVNVTSTLRCTNCDYNFTPEKKVVELSKPLVQKEPHPVMPWQEQCKIMRQISSQWRVINYGRSLRGQDPYKPGWVSVQFKLRCGFWPSKKLLEGVGVI